MKYQTMEFHLQAKKMVCDLVAAGKDLETAAEALDRVDKMKYVGAHAYFTPEEELDVRIARLKEDCEMIENELKKTTESINNATKLFLANRTLCCNSFIEITEGGNNIEINNNKKGVWLFGFVSAEMRKLTEKIKALQDKYNTMTQGIK